MHFGELRDPALRPLKRELYSNVNMILALLLCVGVKTFFRPCPAVGEGLFMECHAAQTLVFFLGIAIMILSVVPQFVDRKVAALPVAGIDILLASASYLTPGIIVTMCLPKGMRCYVFMQPFVRACSLAILIWSAAWFFAMLKWQEEKPDKENDAEEIEEENVIRKDSEDDD